MAAALWRFWYLRDSYAEGRQWLESLLAGGDQGDPVTYAAVLQGLGTMHLPAGNRQQAAAIFQQALAVARQAEDHWRTANVLSALGGVMTNMGDYGAATRYYEDSLRLRRTLNDPGEVADSVVNLGVLAFHQGDYAVAIARFRAALPIFEALGDLEGVARMWSNLGAATLETHQYAEAEQLFTQALTVRYQVGHRSGTMITLVSLGATLIHQEKWAAAQARLGERIGLYQEMEPNEGLLNIVDFGTLLMAVQQRLEPAMVLHGAAERLRGHYAIVSNPMGQAWFASTLATATTQLGAPAVQSALATGAAMGEADILATFLALTPPCDGEPPPRLEPRG